MPMSAPESSLAVVFRALVMLAFLVLVPLAAVFGSAFPRVVRQWLVDPIVAHLDQRPSAAAPAEHPAPVASMRGPQIVTPEPVEARDHGQPVGAVRPASAALASEAWPSPATRTAAPAAPAPLGLAVPAGNDRFTSIERRLREAGAMHYALETWGTDGALYRFHCRMALGPEARHTRQFEAVDVDALQAMTRVLEQVESWRSGAQAGAG
jgi:hypothetical protein